MQDYSVVLVIPDFYDRCYVQNMCTVLLRTMGFKQLCVQQVTYASDLRLIQSLTRPCRNLWLQLTVLEYPMVVLWTWAQQAQVLHVLTTA